MKLEALRPRLWDGLQYMALSHGSLQERLEHLRSQFIVLSGEADSFPRQYQKAVGECVVRARSLADLSDEGARDLAEKMLTIVHSVLFDLYEDDE